MIVEKLGEKILELRQANNLTQEELALRLGVTPQALSKWERGQSLPDLPIFADLCRVLNVSADVLLGLERNYITENNDLERREEIFNNLRYSLYAIGLVFGKELVPVFAEGNYMELMTDERTAMSREGFLLPLVRLRDDSSLGPKEFVITVYSRILYRESVDVVNEDTLRYMIHTLGRLARERYSDLLNHELIKSLTDNLSIRYPALIEGIVPERIPYGLLQEVFKRFLDRGYSPVYLPEVIEVMDSALYEAPDISTEQLVEQVCAAHDSKTGEYLGAFHK